jgi:peroxiredoxin
MGAWGQAQNAEKILMLADGNNEFTKEMGMELDGSGFGLGTRSKRYAMIVEDGVVKALEVDGTGVDKSSAENILTLL